MPSIATDVESVCTDTDLANEIGSADALDELCSSAASRVAARTAALEDVLDSLRNRTPPVYESDLTDVTELKRSVTYGALAKLYKAKITVGDSNDGAFNLSRIHHKLYEGTIGALRPTVSNGLIATPWGIALHRR